MTTRRSPMAIVGVVLPVLLAVCGCAPEPADMVKALDAGGWATHLEVDGFWPYDCHFSIIDGVDGRVDFYPETLERLIATGSGVVSLRSAPPRPAPLGDQLLGIQNGQI